MRKSQLQMVRLFSCVFLTVLACAQQPPASVTPGSVQGQVLSITGTPLRKADVTLRGASTGPPPVVFAVTDASGVFVFENVEPGSYVISAQRTGFVRTEGMRRLAGTPPIQGITVAAGQNVTGISIKLIPHSVITGKVTDEDSDPMFGATVNIMEERYVRGRRALTPRTTAVVNDLGDYRIAGLQPGRYFLAVEPRNEFGPASVRAKQPGEETERSFVTVYYPGVADQSQATPINLEAGQEARGVDIQVRKSPTVHLRGRVLDESGAPVSNTNVIVMNGDNPSMGMGRTSASVRADGTFDISAVPSGSHVLMAHRMAREQGGSVVVANVQVGTRDLDGIVLRMSVPAQITGVVKAAGDPALPNVRVVLDPIDSFPMDMYGSRGMQNGNAFTIGDVAPARYRVDVYGAPDGYYLKSVQMNGQEISDSGLTVTGSAGGLEIVLVQGATTVEGTGIDDAKPVPQSLVGLVPPPGKRDQWRLFKTSMADQNGRFSFRNLSPGEYTLFAFGSGGDPGALQNPEYLKQMEAKGTVVKLGENARESVQLKVVE